MLDFGVTERMKFKKEALSMQLRHFLCELTTRKSSVRGGKSLSFDLLFKNQIT